MMMRCILGAFRLRPADDFVEGDFVELSTGDFDEHSLVSAGPH